MRLTIRNSIILAIIGIMFACNGKQEEGETLFRGDAQIACDREVVEVIAPQIAWFAKRHGDAHLTVDTLSAFEAMSKLLSGSVRAAIVARDYLPQEDSLLRAHGIEPHKRFLIATDAIVFAVPDESTLDTVDESILMQTLHGVRTFLSKYRWALPVQTSSLTASLTKAIGGSIRLPVHQATDGDSVLALLAARKADIGVILLSQYLREKEKAIVRALRIVIRDSATGDRIAVLPHAATIVKERYPFRVPIYGYLLETARNLPYGVIASIAQEAAPQRAILSAGIVPAYAKLQLVEQE